MTDELAQAALARAVGVPISELRDVVVARHGHVFTIDNTRRNNMAYDPYMTFDRHRHRAAEHGGPVVYPRCSAISAGDRCEYRQHRGTHHAAQSGGHLWIEAPLGVCSICDQQVYPLMALARANVDRHEPGWYASLCCEHGVVITDDTLFDDDDEPQPLAPVDPFGSSSGWGGR